MGTAGRKKESPSAFTTLVRKPRGLASGPNGR